MENQSPKTTMKLNRSATKLYNLAETDRIVRILKESLFDPEYILLFGSLAGGTPHNDATAYDLLMAVRNEPDYKWTHVEVI